jgi:hypothetical protein
LLDWLAIRSAGHEAILQFAIGVEFARQQPSDDEQEHHNAESHQGASLAIGSAITVCHATSSKELIAASSPTKTVGQRRSDFGVRAQYGSRARDD